MQTSRGSPVTLAERGALSSRDYRLEAATQRLPPTTTAMDIEYTRGLTLHIPAFYPVLALLGGIQCMLQPATMLQYVTTTPLAPTPPVTPQTHALLILLGGMYIQFAVTEALVLRAATTWSVWRAVMVAMVISDFAHVAGLARLPGGVDALLLSGLRSGNWVTIEWTDALPTYWTFIIRAAFVLGVGVPRPTLARIKKQ
ncbi:hypothetical protein BKA62DRAFT_700901 [Auriculariales sp. MPI-PUGE-AT-0066]|nr:hypothetical protein BKA62DRAFT_700901 [Auriculariales sp. MPI-PUGE-AT-0066]